MATPRAIRRLAFQMVFQMDAQGGADPALIQSWAADAELGETYSVKEREAALAVATAAYRKRGDADAAFEVLAPTWPSRRQASVDRAILRLAHFEMNEGVAPPKAVVNDAIELAKEFSTDRSPAFVNGLLDKVLKQVLARQAGASEAGSGSTPSDPAAPTDAAAGAPADAPTDTGSPAKPEEPAA